MKRIVSGLLIPIASMIFITCPGDAEEQPSTNGDAPEQPSVNDVAVCLQGEPFIADGAFSLAAEGPGDAHEVSELRWVAHEGCERFVIDFAAEDDTPAASVGEVRAEVLRDLGVVRVTLRQVEWVDQEATDAMFDGELARAAYSVWSDEGQWVYVDLHLAEEAEAHVAVLEEPGRVLVDLRLGGGPIPPSAVSDKRVVVLEPRPGEQTYPLAVTGYARTFEANVVARIEQRGEEVFETFTTATAWADAWGHYSLSIEEGPSGPTELHVGEYSARDGTWEGVVVELEMQ